MSNRTIGRNLLANLLGQGWTTAIALLAVPLYLHFLGADGFGLIGFYLTLSALLSVLDGGMAIAVTREVATLSTGTESERHTMRQMLRSIETLFALISIAIAIALALLAPLIARIWLQISEPSVPEMTRALSLMAIALALQFMQGFYNSSLVGLQRQVLLNALNILFATFRTGGAVLALWLASPTASTFFAWQVAAALVSLVVAHVVTWKALGGWRGSDLRFRTLYRSGRFALGAGATNLLGLVLSQLDKVLLSKLLPLHAFGYYMVAWTAGTLALRVAGPVFNAYYPALVDRAKSEDASAAVQQTYMQATRILSVAAAPITAMLVVFGYPVLLAWTRNESLADAASLPLAMIALGTLANAYMHLPYALQLAHARTRIALAQNVIAVILLPPLTYFSATHYGLAGAGLSWLILNAGYLLFSAPLSHRGIVGNISGEWYWRRLAIPFVLSSAITAGFYALSLSSTLPILHIALALAALLASVVACARYARVNPMQLLSRQHDRGGAR